MRFQLKLAVLAAVVLGAAYLGTAAAKDDDIKDIKGCMAFQGKVRKDVPDLLKAKDPNWEEVQKQTKDWVAMAETLGKQKPPRGSDESWKKQSEKYLTTVKDVDSAAQKKDLDGMKKGLGMVGGSCMGCHSQHRPPKK
jgi:cytochrome c556